MTFQFPSPVCTQSNAFSFLKKYREFDLETCLGGGGVD